MVQVAVLGGGRMGEALLTGLRDAGWDLDSIAVAEVDADRRRALEERFPGGRVVPSPAWAVADADVVVVAVEPADVPAARDAAAAAAAASTPPAAPAALAASAEALAAEVLIVSLAAGIPLETLEGHA